MPFQLLSDFDALQRLEERFSDELPLFITDNINPNFSVRDYQVEALNRFNYYISSYRKRKKPTQLLFQMATGSGKTLVMAGCILNLFEKGYRNFIFFVNSTNIIEKTKDNFLNTASSKYLFNSRIQFGDAVVPIKQVENFTNPALDCINIHFTTIQGLHSRLNNPKENSLTFEDFGDINVVMLSDEAHHMNVDTLKNEGKQLSIAEFEEYDSWEGTAMRIFRSNSNNLLLEFTATAELHEPAIAQKYDDKLVYDYSLKKFYLDKYSKEVNVLQANLNRIDRALQAIILSQYRLLVFAAHGILIKPVVLFKSNFVNVPSQRDDDKVVSSEFKELFINKVNLLQVKDIERIKANSAENSIIRNAFDYFEATNTTIENLIYQIKEGFSKDKCISVDSLSDKQETQLLINSLEEPNNEIRAVFAVDALNEGWDVLNLFDIVRLYNTRDAKNGIPGKTTMSEAQLIGRGARYCPFTLNETQAKYQRKYDDDITHPLRICEELYYHSETNSRYIDELNKALDTIGIKPSNSVKRNHYLKEEFKQTEFYKSAYIYTNDALEYRNEDVVEFPQHLKDKKFYYTIKSGFSRENTLLKDVQLQQEIEPIYPHTFEVRILGNTVLRKAAQKLPFYNFQNLTKYYPNLSSLEEFISSDKFLGARQLEIRGTNAQVENMLQEEKLSCAISILETIQPEIQKGNVDKKGSEVFTPKAVKKLFFDKEMNFVLAEDGDAETGYPMSRPKLETHYLDLKKEDWYAFEENYGTSEEKKLILFIKAAIDKLKKKYQQVYLLRNEKYFQIFRFSDGRPFEPDFVLFLKEKKTNENLIYQLFIEPKGDGYLDKDVWKEEFLKDIEHKFIIHQSTEYKLIGLPFYNNTPERLREFTLAFEDYL